MVKRSGWLAVAGVMALAAGSAIAQDAGVAYPGGWPSITVPASDPAIERRIDALLAAMSLEQKVGQIIQGDIGSTTPEDVATYHLGSILSRLPFSWPAIPLSCLPGARLDTVSTPFALSSSTPLRLILSSIALTPVKETSCR